MYNFIFVLSNHLGSHYKVYLKSHYLGNVIYNDEGPFIDYVHASDDNYDTILAELMNIISSYPREF